MAAILRVKRKNTDVPLDTLVIACKRPKTEASLSDTPPVETVAQFAGTLTDPTEDVTKHVAKILPKIDVENHKAGVKRVSDDYPANISGKIPKWTDSMTKRYRIIDCQRSMDISNEEEFKDKWMTLIDVEDCWSMSRSIDQNTEEKEDIEDYVYDLYYAQTSDDIWFESDNIMVRQSEHSDVVFEDEDESSDSNAESNWRNDYPDTDPDHSRDDDSHSRDDDSDDYFDVSIDDVLYGSRKNESIYGYTYRRTKKFESDSSSDSSDDEGNSSGYDETSSNDEEKLGDEEKRLDDD